MSVPEAPERLVVRFRPSGRNLVWSALITIASCAAVGWYWGHLPDGIEHWMLITAAALIIFFLGLVPLVRWASHSYRITTRRVIARSGVVTHNEHEIAHSTGYAIKMRRGPIQRLFGEGTIALTSGNESLVLRNVPNVLLVHEVLADELEHAQVAARRAAYGPGGVYFTPMQ